VGGAIVRNCSHSTIVRTIVQLFHDTMKSQRDSTPKAHVTGHAIPGQRPIRRKPRASPWVYVTSQLKKPQRGETTRRNAVGFAPLGLWRLCGVIFPGALPQAITFRPVGAESQGADSGLAGGRIYRSGTQSRRAVASRLAVTHDELKPFTSPLCRVGNAALMCRTPGSLTVAVP